MKRIRILPILTVLLFSSCASLKSVQPYFEVAALIGTTEFINSAKDAHTRAEYISIIQEAAGAVATLSSGSLLTPEQFHASVVARIPKTEVAGHFVAILDGVYAVAYIDLKDRPELANEYLNRIATIILAAAH